jgi:hypothetical protein
VGNESGGVEHGRGLCLPEAEVSVPRVSRANQAATKGKGKVRFLAAILFTGCIGAPDLGAYEALDTTCVDHICAEFCLVSEDTGGHCGYNAEYQREYCRCNGADAGPDAG